MTRFNWSLLALLACAASAAAQPPETMPQTMYFPLTLGTTWKYETVDAAGKGADGSLITVKVVAVEQVAGQLCARLDTFASRGDSDAASRTFSEHLFVRSRWFLGTRVYRLTSEGVVLDPPVCILELPAAGQRWSFQEKVVDDVVRGEFVAGTANVTVPAYKGPCVTVEGDDVRTNRGRVALKTYYAPGFGPVRKDARIRGGDSETAFSLRLREFTPGRSAGL